MGGFWSFAKAHPWLSVLFVIPAAAYGAVGVTAAITGKNPLGQALNPAPTPPGSTTAPGGLLST